MRKLAFTMICAVSFSAWAQAQDEQGPELSFSGSVDTYYRANLNSTNDASNGGTLAPGTSFANGPGFSLGMFNLITEYGSEKAGFVADMVFGPRGAEAVFGSPAPLNLVNQLYVYWNVSDKVTLTLGNFNTFLGYEVISPTGNFNYSTSYMFSYGPFSHSGLKADVDLGGGFSVMGAVLNTTDATDFNPMGEIYGGAQLGYSNESLDVFVNGLFTSGFWQVDLTSGWTPSDLLYIGLNSTVASDNFTGVAGYLQVSTTDKLAIGARGEYFLDQGVGVLNPDESVVDLTLSANYTIGGLTLIPEFRVDMYSEEDVVITDAVSDSRASALSSFLLAVVFAF